MGETVGQSPQAQDFRGGRRLSAGLTIRHPAQVRVDQHVYSRLDAVGEKYPDLDILRPYARHCLGLTLLQEREILRNAVALKDVTIGQAVGRILLVAPSLAESHTIEVARVSHRIDRDTGVATVTALPQRPDNDKLHETQGRIRGAVESFNSSDHPLDWRRDPLYLAMAYSPDRGDALGEAIEAVEAVVPFEVQLLVPSVVREFIKYQRTQHQG